MHFYIFNNGLLVEKGMSGSDQRVYQWSQIFKKKRHQVSLIIPKVGVNRFKKFGFRLIVTTDRVPLHGDFIAYLYQAWKGIIVVWKMGKIPRDIIIYSSSDLIADSLPTLLLKIRNRKNKMICGLHLVAPPLFKGFAGVWQKGLTLPTLKEIYYFVSQRIIIFFLKYLADLVLVSNPLDRDFLLRKGFKKNQVLVTFGGIDFSLIPKKKFRVKYEAVWVGRLHAQKGVNDLFGAWEKVTETYPLAKLIIIGEPDIEEYFRHCQYSKYLQKNIVFAGYLEGKEKFRIIKESKLSLCPSHYESFGMVIAEALAAKVPVVAYDLPIYKKIYKGGIIIAPIGNINRYSEQIISLLKNEDRRKILSEEAFQVGKEFQWEKTAEKILSSLKESKK